MQRVNEVAQGWRMVVGKGDEISAFGIYPGGQSGNPGIDFTGNFIPIWANGEYLNSTFEQRAVEESCFKRF